MTRHAGALPLYPSRAFSQVHWLAWAYQLEFQHRDVAVMVWLAGCLFLACHVAVLVQLSRREPVDAVSGHKNA
jgi:hypothetical protein